MTLLVLIAIGWIALAAFVSVLFGRMAALNEQPLSEHSREQRQEFYVRAQLRPYTGNVRRIDR